MIRRIASPLLITRFSAKTVLPMVVSLPRNSKKRAEPSVEQIRSQLREAGSALSNGLVSAAVLLAWAALEAALRRTAVDAGYKGKVRVQPTVLIRELYSLGLV